MIMFCSLAVASTKLINILLKLIQGAGNVAILVSPVG